MNILKHLKLGGENLLNCLNPEKNYLPYWHMAVDKNQIAEYSFRPFCTGHNVGRWWHTMLSLEQCCGFKIPGKIESTMLKNVRRLSDNPTGIFLEATDKKNIDSWYIHSYRETLLALALLYKFRGLDSARKQGLLALGQMKKACSNPRIWDLALCSPLLSKEKLKIKGLPVYTHGRAIEGLLCFYEATGEKAALNEACRLADFHFKNTVNSDGSLAAGCGHHTHSYLNTLRGLLRLAGLKKNKNQLNIIRATYRAAIAKMITGSGFVTHNIRDKKGASGGDPASAGDIAHIALMLFEHYKEPGLLDDVERIVRCRLIPAQVCVPMPTKPGTGKQGDCVRNLPRRFIGAIGGSVGHVKGQTCVTDFTAAALHCLIEIYQRTVETTQDAIRVNFHFDYKMAGLRVKSLRSKRKSCVTVQNNTGKDLYIRIPGWVPKATLRLSVNNKPVKITIREGFAFIKASGGKLRAKLCFSLPRYKTTEKWRDNFKTQAFAVFHWRGDEIFKVDPVGKYLKPFPKVCNSFWLDKF